MSKKRMSIATMALIGVLAAMVYVLSSISWQIGDISRLHLGNVMGLLSGVLFGPFVGGMATGLGSMFFDLTSPIYYTEFWITFITKFAMGFLAGLIAHSKSDKAPSFARVLTAAFSGATLYIVLYGIKSVIMQRFLYGNPWVAVWPLVGGKMLISSINGLLAVAACAILAPPLRAALNAAGLYRNRSTNS